jgi:signal transduction histidine kinase
MNEEAEQLMNSNKELEAFIYNASHDLKGPLAASKGLVELACVSSDPNEITEYLGMIRESLNKLDNILVELHEVALIRNGKLIVKKIDPEMTLVTLLNNFKGYPNFSNVKFVIKNEIIRNFYSDEVLMQTIFRNIIENGIKYARPGANDSFVKVTLKEALNGIMVEISDNGIGIPEKFQAKVFDSFFRGTHASSGSGLGLFIVKSATTKLGGTIEISRSNENEGTLFHLFLPSVSLSVI